MINVQIIKNEEHKTWLKIENEYYLFSYLSLVCHISNLGKVTFHSQDKHSMTTLKHIREFLKYFNKEKDEQK